VQLKSGGYIVIGVTEALVAIDVNSGRATKEGSIEDTATKTNLEAAEEVARQLRLRDLAGLIVIDFIDMDERKNNAAVEKRMKDKLKTDRARIQVGRISGFGLMEMSRQRLRPGMIEATTQPCAVCHGTGLIRSDDNLALSILRQIEEEGVRRRSREVLIKCPVGIANYLMNQKREHVAQIEARYGLSVRIEGDPTLVSPDFSMEKFKTATRVVAEVAAPVVSVDSSLMDEVDEDDAQGSDNVPEAEAVSEEEDRPKKRRRRRRRKPKSQRENAGDVSEDSSASPEAGAGEEQSANAEPVAVEADGTTEVAAEVNAEVSAEGEAPVQEEAPKPKRTRTRRKPAAKKAAADAEAAPAEGAAEATPQAAAPEAEAEGAPEVETEKPKPKKRAPRTRRKKAEPVAAEVEAPTEVVAEAVVVTPEPAPAQSAPEPAPEPTPAPEKAPEKAAEEPPAAPDKPKRRGWWAIGR